MVILAQEEARNLHHNYIGTEHILLGLVREREGLAARVLEHNGLTVESVRTQVEKIVGGGSTESAEGQIPFTPRARTVLELSLREALSLGHNYIGTEHILLGLLCHGYDESVAVRVLADLLPLEGEAFVQEKLRDEVLRALSRPGSRQHRPAPVGPETLTYEQVRNGVGSMRVQHVKENFLRGVLVAYGWNEDECCVKLDTIEGVSDSAEIWVQRTSLTATKMGTVYRKA